VLILSQSLAYYYMKTLIYRPAVSSNLGPKAAPALIAVGESSKHIIQIVQLLEERSMAFSFCLNKSDTLILCGMSLLYQTIGLKQDSKVLKDNEKLANVVIGMVDKARAPGSHDFKRVAGLLIAVDDLTPQSLPTPPRHSPDACAPAQPVYRTSPPAPIAPQRRMQTSIGLHVGASVSETDLLLQQEKLRRMTMPHPSQLQGSDQYRARSRQSFDGALRQEPQMARRDNRLSLSQAQAAQAAMIARIATGPNSAAKQNLDYLPLGSTPQSQPSSPVQARGQQTQQHAQQSQLYTSMQQKSGGITADEWDSLLGSIESGQMNLYDVMYSGGPAMALAELSEANGPSTSTASSGGPTTWSPEPWDLLNFNMGEFAPGSATTHSVLSLSEDSLSSGEDLGSSEMGMRVGNMDFRGTMMSVATADGSDGFVLDGLDAFGL